MPLDFLLCRNMGSGHPGQVHVQSMLSKLHRAARLAALGALLTGSLAAVAHAVPLDSRALETLRAQALAFEHGEGVAKDPVRAAALYCTAARAGDADAQFNLGWMFANGRGVERNDAWAAFFFHAAAEQGIVQAQQMLHRVGPPGGALPECMREPERPTRVQAAQAPATATAPAEAPVPVVAPRAIAELVQKMAPSYQIEPQLVLAIIKAESNFDAAALSPKSAMGLMQLIPETAERFNVRNPYDPKQNIRGGMAYLRWLLAYFEGDISLVAAAYNAGEGTVERYRGVPPYRETRNYVQRILRAVGTLAHPFDARVTGPSPRLNSIREVQAAAK
jgi:soluble lytic murein transglycosylase-like protein